MTARGYDGESGPDEEKWQNVVNDYKKLLISCLQFLNNLITQNENRKFQLWIQLFHGAADTVLEPLAAGKLSLTEMIRILEEHNRWSPLDNIFKEARRLALEYQISPREYGPFLLYVSKFAAGVEEDLAAHSPARERNSALAVAQICRQGWASLDQTKLNVSCCDLSA